MVEPSMWNCLINIKLSRKLWYLQIYRYSNLREICFEKYDETYILRVHRFMYIIVVIDIQSYEIVHLAWTTHWTWHTFMLRMINPSICM